MSRRTPRLVAAALAVAALTLGACAEQTDPKQTPGANAGQGTFPVTVGPVTLEKRPERIVSLSPAVTEMLFAIGAGKQVIAVDNNSDYPAEAPTSELSGFQPNAEAVATRSPDLVVLTTDTNKIVDQLTTLRIPVYVAAAATTLEDTYRQLTELGSLTGQVDGAADLTTRMRADITKLIADVPQRTKKLTYFYELDPELYSVTSKTFVGSIFAQVGLVNIADAHDPDGKTGGYPQLSQEIIVKANPDFVFLADAKCCGQNADTVAARSGWAGITAVKNKQVVMLDDDVASRWGPRVVDLLRSIVDAVAKVPA